MEPPLDRQPGAPLDLLCHDLPEQVGLAEVLRAHNDPVGAAAPREQRSDEDD